MKSRFEKLAFPANNEPNPSVEKSRDRVEEKAQALLAEFDKAKPTEYKEWEVTPEMVRVAYDLLGEMIILESDGFYDKETYERPSMIHKALLLEALKGAREVFSLDFVSSEVEDSVINHWAKDETESRENRIQSIKKYKLKEIDKLITTLEKAETQN